MSNCQNCKSDRIVSMYGKVSDLCSVAIGENEHQGFVPDDMGVGGGDDLDFEYCADCGQLQGEFPLHQMKLERDSDDSIDLDDE